MDISQSVSTCFGKFATFKGRASRSEFWWFYLAVTLLSYALQVVVGMQSGDEPSMAISLLLLVGSLVLYIPLIAAATRRLHDTGRSGWWQLLSLTVIGLIPLVIWWATAGSQENNDYGAPLAA